MKKFLSIILTIVLIVSVIPLGDIFALAAQISNVPYGYTAVFTVSDLYNIRNDLTAKYILMNDIDLTEATAKGGSYDFKGNGWNPIGSDDVYGKLAFSGEFDGNGKRIIGMRIEGNTNPNENNKYLGLFANVTGKVHNLIFENTNINWSQPGICYIGSVAGTIDSTGFVYNTTVEVAINLDGEKEKRVGGIAGNSYGKIFRCSTEGSINYKYTYTSGTIHYTSVGGIVGLLGGGIVEECYNEASLKLVNTSSKGAGGHIGGIGGIQLYSPNISHTTPATISNCYNIGNIISNGYSTGGILGEATNNGKIINCYNEGECFKPSGDIKSDFFDTAYFRYSSSELIKSDFDFENVWTMGGDPNYPHPELKYFTLNGKLGIKGDVAYLSTIEPDLSEINRIDDSFIYEWIINGEVVGAGQRYTIQRSDIGKKLQCKVTGSKKHNMGTICCEEVVVCKAKQMDTPTNPIVESITNTSLTLKKITGYEYSKDGTNWQTSNVFVDLSPNTKYALYQRIAENETHCASVSSASASATTLKNAVMAPAAPTVILATETSVTLKKTNEYEYSMDGITWQKSSVFNGLTVMKTYNFYQRVAENHTDYASAPSLALNFKVKYEPDVPQAPSLTEKTNNKISVATVSGHEYSIDKTTWKVNGVFSGLQPNQTYLVYCRTQETDTYYASDASNALTVTTLKNITDTPPAPKAQTIGSNSITLVAISGGEYSKDGTTWQESNVFNGLLPNKMYTFYQRVAETNESYVSQMSVSATFKTLKQTLAAPSAPTLSSKTANSVTLTAKSGYEYSIDGTTWQTSNVFNGLTPNTEYAFYQRVAETDTSYVSEKSDAIKVVTLKETSVTPSKPVAIKITQTKVELQKYKDYEYSKDGVNWQRSNLFTGLSIGTKYTFYQRVAETDTISASEASLGLSITTLPKEECINKAKKPVLVNASNHSISLLKIEGYEYKIGNGSWQSTPIFNNLKWTESYTLYQRIKETATHKASAVSEGLVVNLDMKPSVAFCQSMLSDYIELYGSTLSNGNKKVTRLAGSNYIYFEKTPDGIYCSTYSSSSNGNTSTKIYFGFTLTPDSKYIDPTLLFEGYYGKNLISTLTIDALVDRTTYTNESTIYLDGYQVGSNGHNLFNSNLKFLCTAIHVFLLEELSCGIGGVGFLDFSGENDRAFYCDAAINHQCGDRVLKYGYAASCGQQGYTGDYCCSYCGEIIEKGKTIQSSGTHKYSNSCDTECNDCGFKRDIKHTYSDECDANCNVCNTERLANHLYDNECDSTCNECNHERKAPHIYDGGTDLICNNCGYERPPYTPGDIDGVEGVTDRDAVHLLYHTFLPNLYSVNQNCDFNGDGSVNDKDAIYLLYHTFLPSLYPIG